MKKLLGLVVILAALVLGGYYGMGVVTERTVKHNLDAVNKSNGLYVKIASYDRGWFSSLASLDWRLHVPERIVKTADGQTETVPAQDFEMQMPLTIYHGPVIFANNTIKFGLGYAHTDIPMPAKYNEQFTSIFTSDSTQPKLDLSMFVNYLNNSEVEIAVPSFKLIAKKGGEFSWMGMTSSVDVSSDASKIKGSFNVEGMQFTKDDIKATVGEITTEYNLHKTNSGLYLGDANLSFPTMLVNTKDVKTFELTDLDVHSSCDVEGGLFHSHFKSSVDKIFANGKTYGPGNLEMAIKNLDADVLANINQQVNNAQQGTDEQRQQSMLAIIPEVPKLFSKGAEFEISDLSFVMPEGTVEGSLMVNLPKGDTTNPFELMQKVQGKGKLKVPADLIKLVLNESNKQKILSQTSVDPQAQQVNESTSAVTTTSAGASVTTTTTSTTTPDLSQQVAAMTDAQLAAMMQSGLIVQDGSYYVVEVALNQGNLLVNSKPFNPAMMKF